MGSTKIKVNNFLKNNGLFPSDIDIEKNCNTFIEDMVNGLNNDNSTLKMLCTYISSEGQIPDNEPVIVIDAGGTNLRVAVVSFDENRKAVTEYFKLYPMPGSKEEIGKEEFFETLASYLLPVAQRSNRIGFCFSYPMQMLPDKDGKLIKLSKEVRVRDIEGELVGKNLLLYLNKLGHKSDKKIVMLNDTVAALLGGKAAYPDREYDSYIGFILATGTNTCYIEKNTNITKIPSLMNTPGSTIINIESGGYGRFPITDIDKSFNELTLDPGKQLFEKMVSGAYQGGLLLQIIKKAVDDNLFSKHFAKNFSSISSLSPKQIDDFCYYPFSNENVLANIVNYNNPDSENDRRILYYIIDAMFERAAKLVTINLSAIIRKIGKGTNPCLPVCIAAEGTVYYKSKLFRDKLYYYMKEYLNNKEGIHYEFVKVDNAILLGTAIAGLLN